MYSYGVTEIGLQSSFQYLCSKQGCAKISEICRMAEATMCIVGIICMCACAKFQKCSKYRSLALFVYHSLALHGTRSASMHTTTKATALYNLTIKFNCIPAFLTETGNGRLMGDLRELVWFDCSTYYLENNLFIELIDDGPVSNRFIFNWTTTVSLLQSPDTSIHYIYIGKLCEKQKPFIITGSSSNPPAAVISIRFHPELIWFPIKTATSSCQ